MSASQRSPLLKLEKLQAHVMRFSFYVRDVFPSPNHGSHMRPPAWLANMTHSTVASSIVPQSKDMAHTSGHQPGWQARHTMMWPQEQSQRPVRMGRSRPESSSSLLDGGHSYHIPEVLPSSLAIVSDATWTHQ